MGVLAAALVAMVAGVARWSAAGPADGQRKDLGPDVVILRELRNQYETVPFEHRVHARMAEMWDGCVTCHHRPPQPGGTPATQPSGQPAAPPAAGPTQDASAAIPACKSCHPVSGRDVSLRMPNLKGAYHRQCLSCHREWMHGAACVVCHKPRDAKPAAQDPTRDDVVGRMHPPIPEPDAKVYRTRFTPADGGNVLFRHKVHTEAYGLKCVNCHRRDTCATCHNAKEEGGGPRPVQPGDTWRESHGPCMGCHSRDRCRHCHYKDSKPPPKPFDHGTTRQALDADHAKLACAACHPGLNLRGQPACGEASCHARSQQKAMTYPTMRPGPVATTRPAAETTAALGFDGDHPTLSGAHSPGPSGSGTPGAGTDRPTIERIRR